jgi:hypothetical protein
MNKNSPRLPRYVESKVYIDHDFHNELIGDEKLRKEKEQLKSIKDGKLRVLSLNSAGDKSATQSGAGG